MSFFFISEVRKIFYCAALIAPTLFMIASLIMEGQFFVSKPLKVIERLNGLMLAMVKLL